MTARSGEKELAGLALQQPFGWLYSSRFSTDTLRLKHLFLSAIFLSAFSHRPDWATRFSHRPRHGHLVIPHSDAGSRNTRLGHSALDAESRNTGRSTCKIHSLYVPFPGPSIAVRGDTVLDAVSRIYPLFISKGNSRQYRLGHWGARPPLFFSRKRKGKAKRKLPADVRKLKNGCEVRGKRTRRARFAAAVRLAIQLQVLDRYTSAQTSFPPLSPIGRMASRFGHAALGCGI